MTEQLLSPTFRSSQLHTPHYLSRITIDDPHYSTYARIPLDRMGRHWSYGGIGSPRAWDAPAFKPIHGPPVSKHHDHVGSGLFAKSRGLPVEQFYNLTSLRRSNLRWNDELVPRPLSSRRVKEKEVDRPFPAEHPLASHIPRFAVFPTSPHISSITSRRLRRSLSDCSDANVRLINKTRGGPFRREVIVKGQTQLPFTEDNTQTELMSHRTWDTPRSSITYKRSRSYPGPSILFDSDPSTREGTALAVRPRTARGRESFERSLIQTNYQEEFTPKGSKPDILDLDKLREAGDDNDDDDEERSEEDDLDESGYQGYYLPRPLEGRYSANAASLLPVRRQADERLDTATDANVGVNFRLDTTAKQNRIGRFVTEAALAASTDRTDTLTFRGHKIGRAYGGLERPLSRHHQRQCAFSKTATLRQFHHFYPETSPDLRESIQSGKRHIIHGINGYYLH